VNPPDGLLDRVERLLGSRPVGWLRATGGYSIAERWSLDLEDGRRAFAKLAPTDDIAWRIRDEHRHMTMFDQDFRCEILAFEDGDRPLLLLEDLRDARWPPPWRAGDVERVRETLERIWATPADGLPNADRLRQMFSWWETIASDPTGFLSLGIASEDWLDRCLPTLIEATREAAYEGQDFLHMDVRSDNMCFSEERVVFVDWNWAVRGLRDIDLACWLPALRLEGGPLPEDVEPGLGAYAAGISGYFAHYAHLPPPEGAPTVRRFQHRQLRISLPWACRELGLPRPELNDVTAEIERANADVEAGDCTDDEWYARVEEPLTDAYLSHAEPWRQSGKGGDEADWRWGRELVLDVVHDGDAVLDVGCANGYLMESFHRWGAERGLRLEPYGVDISWRLASLARRRLPHWADRIFDANVMRWTPPRRFDIVHTALDYMPPARRREHVERVLGEFLTPGGRLVLRAARVPPGPDPAAELETIGFRPDGIIESAHPVTGETRRTAWLRAPVR
jgi:SAM-dependent methyltransferase